MGSGAIGCGRQARMGFERQQQLRAERQVSVLVATLCCELLSMDTWPFLGQLGCWRWETGPEHWILIAISSCMQVSGLWKGVLQWHGVLSAGVA
jgi:hypothetical protein